MSDVPTCTCSHCGSPLRVEWQECDAIRNSQGKIVATAKYAIGTCDDCEAGSSTIVIPNSKRAVSYAK